MLYGLLILFFIIVCVLIVVITLIQPHYEEGLGGLMGGAGPDSFFGVRGNITAIKITAILGAIFFILALIINRIPAGKESSEVIKRVADKKAEKVIKAEKEEKKEKTVKAEAEKTGKSVPTPPSKPKEKK